MKPFFAILFLLLSMQLSAQPQGIATVINLRTQFGWVQGDLEGEVYRFLGIPFAKPPVGTLRWKAPESPLAWDDTLFANAYAPACPQQSAQYESARMENDELKIDRGFNGNEDCLYLNVWSPMRGGPKPVMVFIHGGGNQQGSTSLPVYNGRLLAERGGVVLVTIAYRLGPLGFLTHPGLAKENPMGISGNYAVMDQVLALQWVKNNIAVFGGDPNNVTLFGESAGALNTANLLVSPQAKGLFHKAIIQSGAPVVDKKEIALTKGQSLIAKCGCSRPDPLQEMACMRKLTAEELYKFVPSTADPEGSLDAWMPNLDGQVFPREPLEIIFSQQHRQIPVMLGTNMDEGLLFTRWGKQPRDVIAMIEGLPMPDSLKRKAKLFYSPGLTRYSAWVTQADIMGDFVFQYSARTAARALSANQSQPVYRYVFEHRMRGPLKWLGAFHALELAYIFQYELQSNYAKKYPPTGEDDEMQRIMLQYWTNFAKTGNPNGAGLPLWQPFVAQQDNYLEITPNPREKRNFRTQQINLWEQSKLGFEHFAKRQ